MKLWEPTDTNLNWLWESDHHALFVIGDERFLSVLSMIARSSQKIKIINSILLSDGRKGSVENRFGPLPPSLFRLELGVRFSLPLPLLPPPFFSCFALPFFLSYKFLSCSSLFTSWTITIATTPRTCLMAAHTAFIRLSRRPISTWSTHSKASTPIQSCPPPLPRVGITHPHVLISIPTSKLPPPFQNSSRLFRCGP